MVSLRGFFRVSTTYVRWYLFFTIPDKKRNAPLRNVPLSGRSQVIGQFSLYEYKGIAGTAASHIICNLAAKLCQRKLVMNKVRVKL